MQFVWRFMVSVTASNSPRLCLNQPLLSVLWQQHVTQLLHQTLAVWQVNCRQMRHPQEYTSAVRFSPSYTASVGWLFFYCPFFWSLLYFRDFVITEVKICYGFHFHSSIFKKKKKKNKNLYLYGDAWPFPLLTRWVCRWRWGCTPAAEKGSETPRPAPHQ